MAIAQSGAETTRRSQPIRVDAVELSRTVGKAKNGTAKTLLRDVSLSIMPGEMVAIVGGSGAGKTTLLNALAGVKPPSSGEVRYNGQGLYENLAYFRNHLGYVPQDDIVHKELTVERTLQYAGKLRLAAGTTKDELEDAVKDALSSVGLTAQANQKISSLSGGQRKRASIAVELLTKPGVFFLDEPTSGLDPATGRELMKHLRRLAQSGSTVILTTHSPQDISLCDKVVFLARGGYEVFAGTPKEALEYFKAGSFEEIYEGLESGKPSEQWALEFQALQTNGKGAIEDIAEEEVGASARKGAPGSLRQWVVLSKRNWEIMTRNPLTLAILIGSPMAVILMFVALFRTGAFDPASPSPSAALMILFWMSFNSFFFGLTYGLLQISTEFPIFLRERLVFLKTAPYILSKVAVLLPVLVFAVVVMVGALRLFDRLPSEGLNVYGPLSITLLLNALAALTLGLLVSAAVSKPEQVTLALPMLCFPQCLFAGAMLAVPLMAGIGEAISLFLSVRWGFEALGHSLDLNRLLAEGNSPLGPPTLAQYGDSFSRPIGESWIILAAFTPVFLVVTWWVLNKKSSVQN
jgi:ABC-type multidrug transport system ATPase subunit